MTISNRRWLVLAPFLAFLLGAMALLPATRTVYAQDTTTASTVRFVHAYAGGDPIDIYIDGDLMVEALPYGTATVYTSMEPGDYQLQVVGTGFPLSDALVDREFSVDEGAAYSVVIGGGGDEIDGQVYEVDLDAVEEGMARFRILNASPDMGDIDVELGVGDADGMNITPGFDGNIGVSGVGYLGDQGYQEVDAGTYDLIVRHVDSDESAMDVADIDLERGKVYDLIVMGQEANGSLSLLPLITPVSRPCSELLGVGAATDACVRLIHASPDAGAVDIYVGDDPIIQNLSYGEATAFAALNDDDGRIRVVPAGEGWDAAVLDETFGFGTAQAYEVSVLGSLLNDDDDEGLRLRQDEIDLTPLPPGQTRVRVVNALTNADGIDLIVNAGDPLFDDVSFGDAEGYEVLDAGTYDLGVDSNDETDAIVATQSVQMDEGVAYDLFVIGRADDGTAQILILTADTRVREGAQGTPVSIDEETESTGAPDADVTDSTVVSGEEPTSTAIPEAPTTPVLTPEITPTPQ